MAVGRARLAERLRPPPREQSSRSASNSASRSTHAIVDATRPNAELPPAGRPSLLRLPARLHLHVWMPRRKTSSFSYSILFRASTMAILAGELVAFLRLDHEAVESGHQVGREFGQEARPDNLGRLRRHQVGHVIERLAKLRDMPWRRRSSRSARSRLSLASTPRDLTWEVAPCGRTVSPAR